MKMPYGKFKGADIDDLPSGYLKWVAENFKNDAIATQACHEWMEREKYNMHWEEDK